MRPAFEVARDILKAWWQALRPGGGNHQERFLRRVQEIVEEDRRARRAAVERDTPSSVNGPHGPRRARPLNPRAGSGGRGAS